MTPVKSSDPKTARHEQPHIDEAEENYLKDNFRRMFETLKVEMKKSLKEMEENTNKKLKNTNKSFKEKAISLLVLTTGCVLTLTV